MRRKIQAEEWEYEELIKVLQDILGYSGGVWNDNWTIECKSPSGHATSMSVETFKQQIKNRLGIQD